MLHLWTVERILLLSALWIIVRPVVVLGFLDFAKDENLSCVCGLLRTNNRDSPVLRPWNIVVSLRHWDTCTTNLLNLGQALSSPTEDRTDEVIRDWKLIQWWLQREAELDNKSAFRNERTMYIFLTVTVTVAIDVCENPGPIFDCLLLRPPELEPYVE